MLPNSTELVYFYEAALAANFSRAAKKIHISQPTLSMAIKRLEDSLNTTLFYRQKQGLVLTRSGKELFAHVEELLAQWNKIRTQMTAAHQEVKGRVVIGCNAAYIAFIAEGISALLEQHPSLDIHVMSDATQKITDGILDASIDIGLVVDPAEHANLVMTTISHPEITFWVKKNNPRVYNLTSGEAVIICDPMMPQTQMLLDQLPKNMNIRTTFTNSLEGIAHLIMKGDGIGILPECFVRIFYNGQLERVAGAPRCINKSFLVYRVEDKEVTAVQVVLSGLKEVIKLYQQSTGARFNEK